MTVRLREALREATDGLPAYPVYERALATARRTRLRAAAAAAAVLVTVAVMVWSVPVRQLSEVSPSTGSGALPDRIATPPVGTLRVTDPFPIGSAALLFGGMGRDDTVGVVDADSDRYRVLHAGALAPAGGVVLLSPDGARLAYPSSGFTRPRVDIVDLTDGSVQKVAAVADGSLQTSPLGWSPDGRRLVVIDRVPANPERSAYREVLSLVEPGTGTTVHLATAGDNVSVVPGYAVAFAPDNQKLAFQVEDTVTITDLAGTPRRTFHLPADEVLAGKGAWTPDSRALTMAKRQGDRWTLATIDPATGARADLGVPPVSGCSWRMPRPDGCVTAIRLLGWGPDGAAFVVAYQPDPATSIDFADPMEIDQRIAYGHVRTVRLLSLRPGAAAPITRMTAPDDVLAVDVADGVIGAGLTRVADPPDRRGPRFWFWLVVVAAGAVAAAVFGWRWYVRRDLPRR
ncbi:MAG TPA: hypothetical protein VHN18_06215 [Micromonosporaceae bacterium]|nr:hypothetical protein [Micromonosporaceae bacterium]